MYRDRLAEAGESKLGARRHVGALLDLNHATLRNWIEDLERAEGSRPPSAAREADSEEVRALKKRVAELERANEILKTSAAFFAQAELDRRLR
jgi:transposase-like protein